MKLTPFLQELVEARMFYDGKDLKGKSADEISETIYLIIMLLQIIRHSDIKVAKNYADQTSNYKPYAKMHYSATDLSNLLSVLNNQDTYSDKIKVNKNLSIPLFAINRYIDDVRSGPVKINDDASFFYRLEEFLKLYHHSVFRQLRRDVGDWQRLSQADKTRIIQMIRREFDKRASQVDLYLWFKQSFILKEEEEIYNQNAAINILYDHYIEEGIFTQSEVDRARTSLNEQIDFPAIKRFFDMHRPNALVPEVGKWYAPVSFIMSSQINRLVIRRSESPMLLMSADNQLYVLKSNGKPWPFPNSVSGAGTIGHTFFCNTVEEAEGMVTSALLFFDLGDCEMKEFVIPADRTANESTIMERISQPMGLSSIRHDLFGLKSQLWDQSFPLKDIVTVLNQTLKTYRIVFIADYGDTESSYGNVGLNGGGLLGDGTIAVGYNDYLEEFMAGGQGYYEDFVNLCTALIGHELTHREQAIKYSGNLNDVQSPSNMLSYLSDHREIEAYAVQAANELLGQFSTVEILDRLKNDIENLSLYSEGILHFVHNFEPDSAPMKKFIRKLYDLISDSVDECVDNGKCHFEELYDRLLNEGAITREQINEARKDIFENSEHLDLARQFMSTQKADAMAPAAGRWYIPVAISLVGPIKLIEIKYSKDPIQLVAVGEGHNDHRFRINGSICKFPNSANTLMSIGETFFYNDPGIANQVVTLAAMTLAANDWRVEHTVVSTDQNFRSGPTAD